MTRKTDFEEKPEEISFELADRLRKIQAGEKNARVEQIGPIWSQYRSEFTDYNKRHKLRAWREQTWNRFAEFMK